MHLIAGLGNPGTKYTNTRHNAGFLALEQLQKDRDLPSFSLEKKWNALISKGTPTGREAPQEETILVKPLSYMNKSGGPISQVVQFFKIPTENIIVLHDEIDIPTAKIKYKQGGGHAGHNGLRDIIARLGEKEFHRIRIGVDRPNNQQEVADYVLSNFTTQQKMAIDDQQDTIYQYIHAIYTE